MQMEGRPLPRRRLRPKNRPHGHFPRGRPPPRTQPALVDPRTPPARVRPHGRPPPRPGAAEPARDARSLRQPAHWQHPRGTVRLSEDAGAPVGVQPADGDAQLEDGTAQSTVGRSAAGLQPLGGDDSARNRDAEKCAIHHFTVQLLLPVPPLHPRRTRLRHVLGRLRQPAPRPAPAGHRQTAETQPALSRQQPVLRRHPHRMEPLWRAGVRNPPQRQPPKGHHSGTVGRRPALSGDAAGAEQPLQHHHPRESLRHARVS
mmetsp:Transcript_45185/g.88397  ORF Transcript_45185/g.88397 Transcript_45185/m.88397 type:complete len:259 (-) Transcript_45185:222-998(-)